MAVILTGVFTNKGREVLAKSFGKKGGFDLSFASYFKYGMGGWIMTPAGKIPKDPSPALLDVEATGEPGNIWYRKELTELDFTFVPPSIMQVRCMLSGIEANDDGTGEAPRFFEIGVFDENDNMLVYATMAEETKTPNKLLTNYVQAYF